MNIAYRPCRKKDLWPSVRLVISTFNHLRQAAGKEPYRSRPRTIAGLEHLFKKDGENFWCAWAGQKLVGFAAALNRGKQWYLAYLFVHPSYQNKKIGKELLTRVWREEPGVSHALATFAYNPQAVGIYSKFGLTPLCSLPLLDVTANKLIKPATNGVIAKDQINRNDLIWIIQLESKIRGYPHPYEWEFWRKQDDLMIRLFMDNNKPIGYSMVSKTGNIAPAGAITNKYLTKVISETIYLTQLKKKDELRIWCPSSNLDLYQFLVKQGFRIEEFEIFMSDKAYPDFYRYVPAQLAVF